MKDKKLLAKGERYLRKLSGQEWCWLLRKQPRFANKCDWSLLNGRNWSYLLVKQPQFRDKRKENKK